MAIAKYKKVKILELIEAYKNGIDKNKNYLTLVSIYTIELKSYVAMFH